MSYKCNIKCPSCFCFFKLQHKDTKNVYLCRNRNCVVNKQYADCYSMIKYDGTNVSEYICPLFYKDRFYYLTGGAEYTTLGTTYSGSMHDRDYGIILKTGYIKMPVENFPEEIWKLFYRLWNMSIYM